MNPNDWDTAMVLTAILAPLCIALFLLCLAQWGRIKELRQDKHSAISELADVKQRFADSSAKKDETIDRQKQEIERLQKTWGGGRGATVI
jgi:hypothetical protein